MVFAALTSALHFPGKDGALPPSRHVMLLDTLEASSAFLLSALTTQALAAGHPTILMSFTQPWKHYASIGRKLNVPFASSRDSGKLVFVDAGAELSLVQEEMEHPFLTKDTSNGFVDRLFHIILSSLPPVDASSCPPCILLDGVSALFDWKVSSSSIRSFMDACGDMLYQREGTLISQWNVDPILLAADAGKYDRNVRYVAHAADIILSVHGLSSGRARDVDGQLNISRGPRSTDAWFHPSSWHYHLTDSDVQLFPQGMSSGVL